MSAAYYLNRLGHPVTIFEALPRPGGMVSVGIPPYRQPRDVLGREIGILQDLGITVKQGVALGKNLRISDLFKQGFKAVFLGIGSHKSSPLGIKGEDDAIEGVFGGGIDFLRDINLGRELRLGENVVIVGGGNTAIDCARTCLRIGDSQSFHCLSKDGIGDAGRPGRSRRRGEEGVDLHFLTQPVEILALNKKMTGLKCIRMELGDTDKSGRKRPIPVPGSEFVLEADTLIPAIGQTAALDFLSPEDGIEITRHAAIRVDPSTMMTSRSGVFAAGDAVSGPLTVVHGLAGGKRAARMIHEYVTTGTCAPPDSQWIEDLIARIEQDRGVSCYGTDSRQRRWQSFKDKT